MLLRFGDSQFGHFGNEGVHLIFVLSSDVGVVVKLLKWSGWRKGLLSKKGQLLGLDVPWAEERC